MGEGLPLRVCPMGSVSGPRGSFGDGRAMRTAVASKFRQSAGDGTLRIGEMRGSHPCAWHSAAATCGAAVALSALASLLGDWGRSPQQAGACLTLWSEVPEENWPFLLKILAMSVMGAGDALAMSPRRLPSFSHLAFGQSPARAVFWPDFASIWRFRQLSETLPMGGTRHVSTLLRRSPALQPLQLLNTLLWNPCNAISVIRGLHNADAGSVLLGRSRRRVDRQSECLILLDGTPPVPAGQQFFSYVVSAAQIGNNLRNCGSVQFKCDRHQTNGSRRPLPRQLNPTERTFGIDLHAGEEGSAKEGQL